MNLNAPALHTQGLSLWAAGRHLLAGLDWQVHVGQRWAVIGRNAAGKSTLLRALAGLAVPRREGAVHWFGQAQQQCSAADAAAVRAYVPQQASDRFALPVARLLHLSSLGSPDARVCGDTLAGLDAAHLAPRDVTRLSGGERQRVALAQCALQGAPLMLLDEPVSFQDPAHQVRVAQWLCALPGRTLVFSAHDVNWIAQAATHVLALHGDGGWAAGPVGEMLCAAELQRAYGCAWLCLGGLWRAA